MAELFECPDVHLQLPYPPVEVEGPNPVYGKAMLDNVGGNVSELTAVTLYLYNHWSTLESPQLNRVFYQVALVEMRHMEIFALLGQGLGTEMGPWTQAGTRRVYWTPRYNYNCYHPVIRELLQCSIREEQEAIEKYEYQLKSIQDALIQANLQRILEDEYRHLEIFTCIYQQLMD